MANQGFFSDTQETLLNAENLNACLLQWLPESVILATPPGQTGRVFVATDTFRVFRDTGTSIAYIGTLVSEGNQQFFGVKGFAAIPFGPNADPTEPNHLARKAYVDARAYAEGVFGDGSDGDATLTGGSLSRDMFYNNLTLNGTLNTNGYRLYVRGVLQMNNGVIHNNGQSSSLRNGSGPPGASGSLAGGTYGGSGATEYAGGGGGGGGVVFVAAREIRGSGVIQANGGRGNDAISGSGAYVSGGNGVSLNPGLGGGGGSGGSAGYPGGSGGVVTYPIEKVRALPFAVILRDFLQSGFPRIGGGCGGGGGASSATGGSGGGGGGGGGLVVVVYGLKDTGVIFEALGGAGGFGAGGGSNGISGSPGTVIAIRVMGA